MDAEIAEIIIPAIIAMAKAAPSLNITLLILLVRICVETASTAYQSQISTGDI